MKIYLYDNSILNISLQKALEDKFEVVKVSHYTEVDNKGFFIFTNDSLDLDLENKVINYCQKNSITNLRVNMLGLSCYIGPLTTNRTVDLEAFINKIKMNNPDHRILLYENIPKDSNSMPMNSIDKIYLQMCVNKITDIIQIYQYGKSKNVVNRMWIVTNDPINITEHKIVQDENLEEKKLYFDEHTLLKEIRYKLNSDVYRTKMSFDLDYLKDKLLDSNFGVTTNLYVSNNSKYIPMVGAESFMGPELDNNAYGRAFNYNDAYISALLENLERYYNSSNKQGRKTVYGSFNELEKDAIDPRQFGLHTASQLKHPKFEYIEFDDNLKINWVWSWSVKKSQYVLIPEQLVYYFDNTSEKANERFVYDSSNGAALGNNLEEALLYGLFEVIERDNFMVSFFNRLQLTEIDIYTSEMKDVIVLCEYLNSRGYTMHFFDMSMELKVPTIWGVMVNQNSGAVVKTYSAAGAHFDPERALKSALIECVSSVPVYEEVFASTYHVERKKDIFKNVFNLTEFTDHVLYYSHENAIEKLDFLFGDDQPKKSIQDTYPEWYKENKYKGETINDDLNHLIKNTLKYYDDIYLTDLSGNDLNEIGLKCVKVIVPGMQPVTFGHQYNRIIEERIKKGPVLAKRKNQEIDISNMNLTPHPFP